MKVHNLMEDLVSKTVNEIFDEEEKTGHQGFCTCHQCRLDVICYVLNRVTPQYAISGRGLAHLLSDYQDQLQTTADLVALANKGIQTVSATMRPQFVHGAVTEEEEECLFPEGPLFNFPVIEGRVLNGITFEPVSEVSVSLLQDGHLVRMIDGNWQNPYPVSDRAAGSFFFWPFPMKAALPDASKTVDFELTIAAPQYEELHHFIKLEVTADKVFTPSLHYQEAYKTDNLVLFPAGTAEEVTE